MFGKIKQYSVSENDIDISFENLKGKIRFISPEIVNIFAPTESELQFSKAVDNIHFPNVQYSVTDEDNYICICTEVLKILVYDDFKVDFYDKDNKLLCEDYRGDRQPFIRRGKASFAEKEGHKGEKASSGHTVEIIKKAFGDEYFYGFGEKTGHLNKKGYYYENWNTDEPSPHAESFKSLYKSIPFFMTLRQNYAYGILFDNTYKTYFDMCKENSSYYYFAADDGNIDYYFIYGPEVKNVLERYTHLTGRVPLPQMWTLGYQQCRWSYAPEERCMEIAHSFREKDIPCDVIYLDIDYMEGYRVFTWDKVKFKDPKKFTDNLTKLGFKTVTIIDPGVKKDAGYYIYDEGIKNNYFATDKNGEPYVNEVWPGEALYPDFTNSKVRDWWSENQKILVDSGISGVWNDMNEPASFNGPLPDDVIFNEDGRTMRHKEVHNIYGQLMSKATYEGLRKYTGKRPFVITRACYAGIQKYSTVWTGDNQSTWEHLRMAVPMLMNLGLSGVAFCGTDVGGFSFDCTPELLSRWIQLGCFTPLFRNHSSLHTRDQEPWAFDKETEEINRKYIKLRYRLIPYLYDIMYQCENTGLPVMRPLMLHYQKDIKTYEINDQFMFGENIMAAPVVSQGQRARSLYLPEGKWLDFWTHEEITGGKYILKEAPLDICPIYIKKGSFIPMYPVQNYIGEKEIKNLELLVYPGSGEYLHYQDDGESFNYKNGEYNLYSFTMNEENGLNIEIKKLHSGYSKGYDTITMNIVGADVDIVGKIKVNGDKISATVDKNHGCTTAIFHLAN